MNCLRILDGYWSRICTPRDSAMRTNFWLPSAFKSFLNKSIDHGRFLLQPLKRKPLKPMTLLRSNSVVWMRWPTSTLAGTMRSAYAQALISSLAISPSTPPRQLPHLQIWSIPADRHEPSQTLAAGASITSSTCYGTLKPNLLQAHRRPPINAVSLISLSNPNSLDKKAESPGNAGRNQNACGDFPHGMNEVWGLGENGNIGSGTGGNINWVVAATAGTSGGPTAHQLPMVALWNEWPGTAGAILCSLISLIFFPLDHTDVFCATRPLPVFPASYLRQTKTIL